MRRELREKSPIPGTKFQDPVDSGFKFFKKIQNLKSHRPGKSFLSEPSQVHYRVVTSDKFGLSDHYETAMLCHYFPGNYIDVTVIVGISAV